jgi:hypothetical protein
MKFEVLEQTENSAGTQTVLTLKNLSFRDSHPSIASVNNKHYVISSYRYGENNSVVLNTLINADLIGKEIHLS